MFYSSLRLLGYRPWAIMKAGGQENQERSWVGVLVGPSSGEEQEGSEMWMA